MKFQILIIVIFISNTISRGEIARADNRDMSAVFSSMWQSCLYWRTIRNKPLIDADVLIEQLKFADFNDRKVDLLKQMLHYAKNEDAPKLLSAIAEQFDSTNSSEVRFRAQNAYALICMVHKLKYSDRFLELINDDEPKIAHYVPFVCTHRACTDTNTMAILLKAMQRNNPDLRSKIVGTLKDRFVNEPEAIAAIEKSLVDNDVCVRVNSHVAIYEIKKDYDKFIKFSILTALPQNAVFDPASKKSKIRQEFDAELSAYSLCIRINELINEDAVKFSRSLVDSLKSDDPKLAASALRIISVYGKTNPKLKEALIKNDIPAKLEKLSKKSSDSAQSFLDAKAAIESKYEQEYFGDDETELDTLETLSGEKLKHLTQEKAKKESSGFFSFPVPKDM